MITRTIPAKTHGRCLLVPAKAAAGVLVGFHGYAHNAEILLDDLQKIPDVDRWTIACIEGLHRFYNRENRVVASWMTRQDRDLAIEDNIAYVEGALDLVAREFGEPRRIVFLGFSQGVAMAYRAAAHTRRQNHGVIALAGDVPPELAGGDRRLPRVLIGRGTTDSWYTEQKMTADLQTLERVGVPVQPFVFDGGHEWSTPFFTAAGRFLADVAGTDR